MPVENRGLRKRHSMPQALRALNGAFRKGENMAYYIGIDIGGTKCAVCLGEAKGRELPRIVKKEQFATADVTPTSALERFARFIERARADYEIEGIGISCGGPLDSKRGIIQAPPSLPAWKDVHVVDYFEKRFHIKTRLQNDANACAVAEWSYGAGRGTENMVFLTFGTGFGAGLILGGRLYSGTNDNAGEIGHVRLTPNGPLGYFKHGSCEGYCSGSGLKRLAELLSTRKSYEKSYAEYVAAVGSDNVSAKTLAEHARKGNAFCKAVYKKSGEMLGRTLSILVDLLNPEAIVIGGVYMRANDLLSPSMKKVMQGECLPFSLGVTKVLPAALSENVGDIAALSIAAADF